MKTVGFAQISRKFYNDHNFLSLSCEYRSIFMTILMNCEYETSEMYDHGEKIILQPGQFLTTTRELAALSFPPHLDEKEAVKNRSLVRRALVKFKKLGFSAHKTAHKKTVVTITREHILESLGPRIGQRTAQERPIINKDNKDNNIKEINHPQTPSYPEVQKSRSDSIDLMIDFFGIGISEKDLIGLRELAAEVDLQRCVEELKPRFHGKTVTSWPALIKTHLAKNKDKFFLKNNDTNLKNLVQTYQRCKEKIQQQSEARVFQSDDKKYLIVAEGNRQEKISMLDDSHVFSQKMETCFRKFGIWTPTNEKIVSIVGTKCL